MVNVVDDFDTGTIPVAAQGKAVIVGVTVPSSFTPGVPFDIDTTIRNDGEDDYLFGRLVDTDTGDTLDEFTTLKKIYAGYSWVYDVTLTLDQTTAFNWLIEVGHVE